MGGCTSKATKTMSKQMHGQQSSAASNTRTTTTPVVNTNTTAHESITTRPAPTNGVLTKTEAGFVTNQDVVRDAVVLLLQQAKCTSTHTSTPTHPHTHIRDPRSEGHIGTTTSTRHRPIKARTHVHRPAISRWADAKLHWLMQRPLAKLTIRNYVKGIQLHASLCQNLNLSLIHI